MTILVWKTNRPQPTDAQLKRRHKQLLTKSGRRVDRPVDELVEEYAAWAREQGLDTIHVFPHGTSRHANEVRSRLATQFNLEEVNARDYT